MPCGEVIIDHLRRFRVSHGRLQPLDRSMDGRGDASGGRRREEEAGTPRHIRLRSGGRCQGQSRLTRIRPALSPVSGLRRRFHCGRRGAAIRRSPSLFPFPMPCKAHARQGSNFRMGQPDLRAPSRRSLTEKGCRERQTGKGRREKAGCLWATIEIGHATEVRRRGAPRWFSEWCPLVWSRAGSSRRQ